MRKRDFEKNGFKVWTPVKCELVHLFWHNGYSYNLCDVLWYELCRKKLTRTTHGHQQGKNLRFLGLSALCSFRLPIIRGNLVKTTTGIIRDKYSTSTTAYVVTGNQIRQVRWLAEMALLSHSSWTNGPMRIVLIRRQFVLNSYVGMTKLNLLQLEWSL